MLVDTNILLRLTDQADPKHRLTATTIGELERLGHTLSIVPQVVYEYWSVATRPVQDNGLGLSVEEANAIVEDFVVLFRLHRDERSIFDDWWQLVRTVGVIGRSVHDTRLVAAMKRHGITELLTFDAKDFQRYDGITVIVPGQAA